MPELAGQYYDPIRDKTVTAEYIPENGNYLVYSRPHAESGKTLTPSQLRRAISKGELRRGGRDPLLSGNLEDLL